MAMHAPPTTGRAMAEWLYGERGVVVGAEYGPDTNQ
jgi:hypothetical protein